MSHINARLIVAEDGSVRLAAPLGLPPGAYEAVVIVQDAPKKKFSIEDFPVFDGPWDDSVSLRREDMYRDAGR